MDIADNEWFTYSGFTLNMEERTCLQSSLSILRDSQSFARILFWGKINGIQKDYYIAMAAGVDFLKDRHYFMSLNAVNWTQLPVISEDEKFSGQLIKQRFMGDPAFEYTIPNAANKDQSNNDSGSNSANGAAVTSITEEKRLSALVAQIEHDTFVVPRGALFRNAYQQIRENPSFTGLGEVESGEAFFYFHARNSSKGGLETRALREPEQVIDSIDVLDAITLDDPKGVWSLSQERGGAVVVLRNLKWPGSVAIHVPHTPKHGSLYCGTGLPNYELGFAI